MSLNGDYSNGLLVSKYMLVIVLFYDKKDECSCGILAFKSFLFLVHFFLTILMGVTRIKLA